MFKKFQHWLTVSILTAFGRGWISKSLTYRLGRGLKLRGFGEAKY